MTTQQTEYARLAHRCVWDAINYLEKCGGRDGIDKETLVTAFQKLTDVSALLYAEI